MPGHALSAGYVASFASLIRKNEKRGKTGTLPSLIGVAIKIWEVSLILQSFMRFPFLASCFGIFAPNSLHFSVRLIATIQNLEVHII